MRSPSSAPCVNGLVGSTESTPTVRPSGARWRQSAEIRRRLARAGRPGQADVGGASGVREDERHQLGAARVAVLDQADRAGDGAAIAREDAAGELGGVSGPAAGPGRRAQRGLLVRVRIHAPTPTIANSTPAAHSSQAAPASRPSENRPSAPEADRRQPQGVSASPDGGASSRAPRRAPRRPRGSRSRRGRAPSSASSCRRAAGTCCDDLGEADAADDEDEEGAERDGCRRAPVRVARAGARAGPARDGVAAARARGADGAGEGALDVAGIALRRRAARARGPARRADAVQVGELELDRPGRHVESAARAAPRRRAERGRRRSRPARRARSARRPRPTRRRAGAGRRSGRRDRAGRNPQDARLGIRCHERPTIPFAPCRASVTCRCSRSASFFCRARCCPLHIFEPRYREMVARCLAGPEPFCVVHADDDGMRDIGCLAIGLEIVERFDDGRLSIVVTGGEPIRIERVDEDTHAYLAADGVTIEDDGRSRDSGGGRAGARRLPRARRRRRGRRWPAGARGRRAALVRDRRPHRLRPRGQAATARGALGARAGWTRSSQLVVRATKAVRTASAVSARAHTNGRVSPPDEIDIGDGPPADE